MDHRNRIRYTILEITIIFGLQYQINNETKKMNVLVFLYSYYKYNNSQTIIYNGTIIFKIQRLQICYGFIMFLQIKANTRADAQVKI